jgi:hypothetical protein
MALAITDATFGGSSFEIRQTSYGGFGQHGVVPVE